MKHNGMPADFPNNKEMPALMCGGAPPLVIHHIIDPDNMRKLGSVVQDCSFSAVASE